MRYEQVDPARLDVGQELLKAIAIGVCIQHSILILSDDMPAVPIRGVPVPALRAGRLILSAAACLAVLTRV